MSLYQKFIQNERLRRFCVLALIIFVLYLSRSMITTILLTFIFTYLAVRLVHFVQRYTPYDMAAHSVLCCRFVRPQYLKTDTDLSSNSKVLHAQSSQFPDHSFYECCEFH